MNPSLRVATVAIVLLVLFVIFGPQLGDGHAGQSPVRDTASQLATALTAYQTEYGAYPDATDGELIRVLSGRNPRQIVFLEVAPKQLDSAGRLIDPWGSPYRILLPARGTKVKVWSIGPDKTDNQGRTDSDDIGNG